MVVRLYTLSFYDYIITELSYIKNSLNDCELRNIELITYINTTDSKKIYNEAEKHLLNAKNYFKENMKKVNIKVLLKKLKNVTSEEEAYKNEYKLI